MMLPMMFLWPVLLVAAAALALARLLERHAADVRRWVQQGVATYLPRASGPGDHAAAILRERYARGELTREQFDQLRHDLAERPA